MDGIITASDDIAKRYDHHDNVITVTNYPPKKWAELVVESKESSEIQLVYSGLLSEKRGILTIIEAVKAVPEEYDVVLKLGGRYEGDEFRDRVEAAAADTDRVELLGWLPSLRDVIELYYRSDVGLMCFQPEAKNLTYGAYRSNKLFQYMAAGIPVMVSDIGNWPEVVQKHDCGVVVTPKADKIAEALVAYINDPERREEHGANGKQAVIEQYNWEQQRNNFLEFYSRLTET